MLDERNERAGDDASRCLQPDASALAFLTPLVVDLDGTLLSTDSLWEGVIRLLIREPLVACLIPFWLLRGRAFLKTSIASHVPWQSLKAPFNEALVEYLRNQRERGRTLVLATAAHRSIAEEIASQVGFFDMVLATEPPENLNGERKLIAIKEKVGNRFSYAGNSDDDLPIWREAESAIVVGSSLKRLNRVAKLTPIECTFAGPGRGWRDLIRSLRVHQWLKNLLVFVPLVTSLTFMFPDYWLRAIICFVAFNLVASGTYIINDLLDLDHDRSHSRKKYRPLASGALSIPGSLGASLMLITLGILIAASISVTLLSILGGYIFLTLSYSSVLKSHVVADIIVLACLYTLRIVAGASAIEVTLSQWLLSFSCLIFLGLAVLKRCAELAALSEGNNRRAPGRDYAAADLRVLWPMGIASSFCSVVVFELFMASQSQSASQFPTSWITSAILLYWLTRLWVKTSRGMMSDDPIVFAMTDRGSRITVLMIVLSFVLLRIPSVLWERSLGAP
jgi:4-hydroxybenzoate polyprenyltransferase